MGSTERLPRAYKDILPREGSRRGHCAIRSRGGTAFTPVPSTCADLPYIIIVNLQALIELLPARVAGYARAILLEKSPSLELYLLSWPRCCMA